MSIVGLCVFVWYIIYAHKHTHVLIFVYGYTTHQGNKIQGVSVANIFLHPRSEPQVCAMKDRSDCMSMKNTSGSPL